jgi:hypothetical protein
MLVAALAASLALSTGGVPSFASDPPSTTVANPPQVAKLKCEKVVVLGSRMPVRVCRTQAQIEAQAKATEDTMRGIKSDIMLSPPPDIKR